MNVVQGHHHSMFEVRYVNTSRALLWSVITGCMIDDKSMAFGYNKMQNKRPALGCTIILDGQPKLLPMLLTEEGRWNRKIV
jgi:hypothetical protein